MSVTLYILQRKRTSQVVGSSCLSLVVLLVYVICLANKAWSWN